MAARDFYEVLGIARDADEEEIQRAYRVLVRRYHPDVNRQPGAEARLKEITEAYRVLSDPELRARYDRFGPRFREVPQDAEPTGSPFGGGRGGAGRVRVDTGPFGGRGLGDPGFRGAGFPRADYIGSGYSRPFGGFGFDDLFSGLFGGWRGYGRPWVPGADREAEVELTVEEAYTGVRRRLRIATRSGPREYEVPIPAGVTDGQRLRFTGHGTPGTGGAPAGDLNVVVRLAPHRVYRVEGRDVTVEVPVAAWEAALGASVPVPTPAGTPHVDVPPGSSSGLRLRLQGRGLPNPRGVRGDLYAEIRIVMPAALTADEQELFEQLAERSPFEPRAGAR
jgi:curved DNA-binding protein